MEGNKVMKSKYGNCSECGSSLIPVWFIEEEYIIRDGIMYETGRTRKAVDYLFCPNCLNEECVDESFDGPWR